MCVCGGGAVVSLAVWRWNTVMNLCVCVWGGGGGGH